MLELQATNEYNSFLCVFAAEAGLGEIPDASQLTGISEFQPLQPSSESQSSVAQLLSVLREKGAQDRPPALATIATGEGLPALSKKLVERIQAGEFVDFAEMPPAKGKIKGTPSSLEGQILVIQAADLLESRKLIPDLATWVQCYSVYMAVVTAKSPERTRNMLAYLTLIAKCSLKYRWPSWLVYDQNFRQQAAEVGLKD